ncbi:MAG: endonuclease domain-containing protein [Acidimicrobiia bacterium]|nr:endonuclease domain-containing protein [Acidimicrobiia bacterium]
MDKRLTEFARRNRQDPTWAEAMIWADLRRRQLGYRFRRQQPIGRFIVDFVCFEKNLIVELDGWSHHLEQNWRHDEKRHQRLEREGYSILRFNDHDVRDNRESVVEAIDIALHGR